MLAQEGTFWYSVKQQAHILKNHKNFVLAFSKKPPFLKVSAQKSSSTRKWDIFFRKKRLFVHIIQACNNEVFDLDFCIEKLAINAISNFLSGLVTFNLSRLMTQKAAHIYLIQKALINFFSTYLISCMSNKLLGNNPYVASDIQIVPWGINLEQCTKKLMLLCRSTLDKVHAFC